MQVNYLQNLLQHLYGIPNKSISNESNISKCLTVTIITINQYNQMSNCNQYNHYLTVNIPVMSQQVSNLYRQSIF